MGGVVGRIVERELRPNARTTTNRVAAGGRIVTRLDGPLPVEVETLQRRGEVVGVGLPADLAVGEDVQAGVLLRTDRQQRRVDLAADDRHEADAAVGGALGDLERLAEMGRAGRTIVDEEFSWEIAGAATLELYGELLQASATWYEEPANRAARAQRDNREVILVGTAPDPTAPNVRLLSATDAVRHEMRESSGRTANLIEWHVAPALERLLRERPSPATPRTRSRTSSAATSTTPACACGG